MFPQGFEEKMRRLLGAEYDEFLASYDRPRQVGLRLNPLKCAAFPDLSCFGLRRIDWAENGYFYDPATRPGLHPWHEAGLYYLQEPSAMAPAALADARPGERVLDLCAAPGGKSTQLAAAMAGRGILVSNEYNPKRAKILARNLERMAVPNALVLNEHPQRLAERFAAWFDRVVVDAPCSGEGMFRKEDAAVTDWSQQTVLMCARRQGEILRSAAQMVAPGGRLVYSTCTFAPEENEGVLSSFLREFPDFSVEQIDAPWFSPARSDWIKDPAPGLERAFRLWPHRIAGEGHFAAVLRRNSDGARSELPPEPGMKMPRELQDFAVSTLPPLPEGNPVAFGENWYLLPPETPRLAGLKVLRAGLELGQTRKGRFEPAHALALWCRTAVSVADFDADGAEIAAYLRGESLAGSQTGWTLITASGLSLGWAKGSGGQLKNHFPKGLRWLSR